MGGRGRSDQARVRRLTVLKAPSERERCHAKTFGQKVLGIALGEGGGQDASGAEHLLGLLYVIGGAEVGIPVHRPTVVQVDEVESPAGLFKARTGPPLDTLHLHLLSRKGHRLVRPEDGGLPGLSPESSGGAERGGVEDKGPPRARENAPQPPVHHLLRPAAGPHANNLSVEAIPLFSFFVTAKGGPMGGRGRSDQARVSMADVSFFPTGSRDTPST